MTNAPAFSPLRLAIVACPRSGTRYTASLLQALHVGCGHELVAVAETGLVVPPRMPPLVADASWLLVPFLGRVEDAGVSIAMQVRHPLRAIPSIARRGLLELEGNRLDRSTLAGAFGSFARRYCPRALEGRTPLERAALFWVYWNRSILAAAPAIRIQVEDLKPGELIRLAELAGAQVSLEEAGAALAFAPRDLNRSRAAPPSLAWSDLGAAEGEVRGLADLLGYGAASAAPARGGMVCRLGDAAGSISGGPAA